MRITPDRTAWNRGRLRAYDRVLFLCLLLYGAVACADIDSSNFTLRVGYQPYFAEAWSGSIIRASRLDASKLPQNVRVDYRIGLQGAGVLVEAMRHGELDIAYLGITPTLLLTQGSDAGEFTIIAVASISSNLCNVLVAIKSAPPGASVDAAAHFLDGKRVGVPRGTCAELFLSDLIDARKLRPARIVYLSPDLLGVSLSAGKIDAVAVWEPFAASLIHDQLATRILTGRETDQSSGTFLVVRRSVLASHPQVVRGWLEAERAAQQRLADRTDQQRTLALLGSQIRDIEADVIGSVLTKIVSPDSTTRYPYVVTSTVNDMLARAARRMADRKWIGHGELRPGTVSDELARNVLSLTALDTTAQLVRP